MKEEEKTLNHEILAVQLQLFCRVHFFNFFIFFYLFFYFFFIQVFNYFRWESTDKKHQLCVLHHYITKNTA